MAAALNTKTLRFGKKQVFLPDHTIAFLRPDKAHPQPPNFATFKVPLTFNKLDIRDYLHHAYGVRTLGVRSQLKQLMPRRVPGKSGRYVRPPPIKTMTVELVRPFVWPALPEDTTPWISEREKRRAETEKNIEFERDRVLATGKPLRLHEKAPTIGRVSLREEAARLLRGEGRRWENFLPLDPKFGDKSGERGLALLGKGKGKGQGKGKGGQGKWGKARDRDSDVD